MNDSNKKNPIKKSIELFEKGSYRKALKIFKAILKKNPIDDLILRYMGETLAKLGRYQEALESYDKAIQILPHNRTEELWILKGKAFSQCSEFDKAIESFEQVLKLNPGSEIAHKGKLNVDKLREEDIVKKKNIVSKKREKHIRKHVSSDFFVRNMYKSIVEIVDSSENYEGGYVAYKIILNLDPNDIPTLYNIGLTAYNLKKYEESIKYCDKILKMVPEFEQVWYYKGLSFQFLNKSEEALHCFNEAIKLDPTFKDALHAKNIILNSSKRTENIEDRYKTALKSDTQDMSETKLSDRDPIEALRNRTIQPKNANEHERKIRLFEEAIKKNPNNSNSKSDMGNEYLGLGKYDIAIKCYNEALKLDPNKFFFKLNKGTAYLLSERYHNAAECYREALKMRPGDPNLTFLNKVATLKIIEKTPSVYDNEGEKQYLLKRSQSVRDWCDRGLDAIDANRYEKALNCFDEALRIDNDFACALLQKGNIFYFRKESKEAIRWYNKIVKMNLNHPAMMLELWVNKGVCHRRIGEKENALNCYRKALEISPKDFDAWMNIGNILSDLNRLDEALDYLNSAIKLAGEENFKSAKMRCNKGLVLVQMRRYNEVIDIINESLEIDPVYPPSWLARGLALKGLNKPREAIECFNESLRINPNMSLALYEKATLLYDLEEHGEALVCFDILSKLDPGLISNDHKKIQLIRKLAETEKPQMKFCVHCGMKLKGTEKICVDCYKGFTEWFEKGLTSKKNMEYANAILYFDKCLDLDLNNADVWLCIAEVYDFLKRFEYAEQCFNKSLQLNPKNPNASKVRDKMYQASFLESGIFFCLSNPIKGLKVEGNNLKEKCTRALKVFRPYLILNNSTLKIVDIKNKMVHIAIMGDLNEPFGPPHPIHFDIESFLRTIDPNLNIVVVKFV